MKRIFFGVVLLLIITSCGGNTNNVTILPAESERYTQEEINDTYSGWQWILVREDGGKWQHRDHGYG